MTRTFDTTDQPWQQTLSTIHQELELDPRNATYTTRNIPPIMQVHANAKILLIGQAPGSHVEKSLIPFHDRSGDTLMRRMGIDANTFYSPSIAILPMDFYYPGKGKTGDLPPRPFIAKEYHPRLLALMPQVQLIILIGSYAMKYYLGKSMQANLTETVHAFSSYLPTYFPIVHPSPLNFRWQKANPWFEQTVVPKLQSCVHEIL